MDRGLCQAEALCNHRAGASGDDCYRQAAGTRLSRDESCARSQAVPVVGDSLQPGRQFPAHAPRFRGGSCFRTGDRLRERRQFAAGAEFRPAAGDGRPPFGWGEIQPAAETASDRTIGAVVAGRCRRIPDRVLEPEPDRLIPAHRAGRTGEHAGRN